MSPEDAQFLVPVCMSNCQTRPHSRQSGLVRRPRCSLVALALVALGLAADSGPAADWPSKAERDAAAKALDIGESAPNWLVESETYAFGADPNLWESLAASKVAFVTHCPVNRA